jgi:hypothetical protein
MTSVALGEILRCSVTGVDSGVTRTESSVSRFFWSAMRWASLYVVSPCTVWAIVVRHAKDVEWSESGRNCMGKRQIAVTGVWQARDNGVSWVAKKCEVAWVAWVHSWIVRVNGVARKSVVIARSRPIVMCRCIGCLLRFLFLGVAVVAAV